MADIEGAAGKANIPKLDKKNFLHWSMRMKAHLLAVAKAVAKKHAETVDILMNYMTENVFESVITPDNEESPHQIWTSITSQFASTSVNNKGHVWLKFMSFSILAKLDEDLYNVVNNIIMNKVICKSSSATLTKLQEIVHLEESRKVKHKSLTISKAANETAENVLALIHKSSKKGVRKKKQDPYCKPGKHNPAATSHDAYHCYQLHPHLRPPQFTKQSEKAKTQLMEVDDGHESEFSLLLVKSENKPIVLDSGHMVNDPVCFTPVAETNVKISTGGHSNLLYATAIGQATLVNQEGKTVILETTFKLFYSNKEKSETVWKEITSSKAFK
ncbi:uncharacterized protein VP01_15g9 [Puccinia sorghi]|uniref:DUF4219 domain-containing protein n=1 Tax=Puccinia sorghi TaxID=27349 RepID=A0A0L6VJ72_9BASI|nr:uncharacterized protein VP01_15g9 [Puccinia sorghi]